MTDDAPQPLTDPLVDSPSVEPKVESRSRWRLLGGVVLNLWLAWHCAAVFIAPAAVAPSSPLFGGLWEWFSPYLHLLYLNHGYHYFAPEPSSAMLLGYSLEYADGRIETGRLPNRGIQPRLLYHRYFMLTEQLAGLDRMEEDLKEQWIQSYAQALCYETGAVKVTLTRIRHNLPRMERIRAGGTLEDPDLFEEEFLGTFHRK